MVQITGRNQPFGGISELVVGDLHQLPPVGDRKVFKPLKNPNNNAIGALLGPVSELWENFKYFELTEVMRQKDDADFVNALNNLVIGRMTNANVNLIRTRETNARDVPSDAIRLYHSNEEVDKYNAARIKSAPGPLFKHKATDFVTGKISKAMKRMKLKALRNKKRHETFGLSHWLDLKVGIKYMMTSNLDIEDGLVNGASGILRHIEFNPNTNTPKVLYFEFDSDRTGQKAR